MKADFENQLYDVEIYNEKQGEDAVNEMYCIPFGFEVSLTNGNV
mgnify:CR=1 FL=1